MNTEITNESIKRKDAKVLLDEANESKITFTDKVIFSVEGSSSNKSTTISVENEGNGVYKSVINIYDSDNINIKELNNEILNEQELFERVLVSTGATLG